MKMCQLLQSSVQACQQRSVFNVLTSATPGVKGVLAVARYFHHQKKNGVWSTTQICNRFAITAPKKVYVIIYSYIPSKEPSIVYFTCNPVVRDIPVAMITFEG